MAIKDLIRPAPTPASERPPGITCEKYTRGEGKRCVHFQQGGTCALPDEFVCTEWQKHNGPNKRVLPSPPEPTPKPRPVPVPPTKPDAGEAPGIGLGGLRDLSSEDIASFKALGVEVLLRSDTYGELWLVPEYTGQQRKEITPEHAATVMRVLSVFPGSQVISFEKSPNHPERPERPTRRS